MKINIILLALLVSIPSFGGWDSAARSYTQRMSKTKKIRTLVINLVEDKSYYAALPWMKEYLILGTRKLDNKLEASLSKLIEKVGVKQFEVLPLKYLVRSRANSLRYIIAKKYMKKNKHARALSYLKDIKKNHRIYPIAKNLEATIYAIEGRTATAVRAFEECTSASNKWLKREVTRRYITNRDYCILGKARAQFGAGKYDQSDLLYLDIPKSSIVWPEILFEEAWNSYHQKNYNRSLGKLVSYKAPVFDYIFNPEIEVLKALSYLKMCLYTDAKSVSDNFYDDYLKNTRRLRIFLKRNRRKHSLFYEMMLNFESSGRIGSSLTTKLFKSINRDLAYKDLKKGLIAAAKEYDRVREKSSSRLKRHVISNIKDSIKTQKKIIGSYISGKLVSHYASLYKAFEGMSYIKLEVLAQRKAKLYSFDDEKSERGDIKYIQKNEKQYFWNFNGEFWADELGDYVFALKSEC